MQLASDASFDSRAFKRFMACLFVSQQTRKEDRDAAEKDSEPQSATMLPSSDEHHTETNIVMHSEESVDDRTLEIGSHITVAGHVSGHAVDQYAAGIIGVQRLEGYKKQVVTEGCLR